VGAAAASLVVADYSIVAGWSSLPPLPTVLSGLFSALAPMAGALAAAFVLRKERSAVGALVAGALALAVSSAARAEEQYPKMDKYELVLLYAVPTRPKLPAAEAEAMQAAHLEHLREMAREGKMFVAGPFDDQPDPALRGMCLYRVGSLAEARKLAEEDPSVKAGRLRVEVLTWYTEKGALTFPAAEKLRAQARPAQ
jgi:uncharacterized protein YciI